MRRWLEELWKVGAVERYERALSAEVSGLPASNVEPRELEFAF